MMSTSTYTLPVTIEPLEDGGYLAVCETIQGCHAEGDTIEEALAEIEDVAMILVELCLEENLPLPEDLKRTLPRRIHAQLIERAAPDPIPPGELAGLRVFELRVGAYAGQRYPERPEWVELDGRREEVAAIETQWREEERLGWRVKLRDGRRLLLYYVPNEDLWSGVVQHDG